MSTVRTASITPPVSRHRPATASAVVALLKPLAKDITLSVGSSEADMPVKTLMSKSPYPGSLSASGLARFMKLPTSVHLKGQSATTFFKDAIADLRGYAKDAKARNDSAGVARWTREADRLETLFTALKSNTTDLQMYQDVNDDTVEGKVFFVGKAPDGKLVGLQTSRIWT